MTTKHKIIFWIIVVVIILIAGGIVYVTVRRSKSSASLHNVATAPLVDTGVEVMSTAQAAANPIAVFRLNLTGQKLTAVPAIVFRLPNLTLLNLSNNDLTSIPPEIGTLTNLQVLYLNGNPQLTSLPDEIGNLSNLRMLSLLGDGFTSLPQGLISLWMLPPPGGPASLPRSLWLTGNPMAQSTGAMTALREELPNVQIVTN